MRNQKGDTLIEVLIASLIIGIVLLTAYSITLQSFRLSQISAERTEASQIAQTQAEGLRAIRDGAGSWEEFQNLVQQLMSPVKDHVSCSGTYSLGSDPVVAASDGLFNLDVDGSEQWEVQQGTECVQLDDGVTYEIGIAGTFQHAGVTGTGGTNPGSDEDSDSQTIFTVGEGEQRFSGIVSVSWERAGGGGFESTSVAVKLSEEETTVEPYYPPEVIEFTPSVPFCTPKPAPTPEKDFIFGEVITSPTPTPLPPTPEPTCKPTPTPPPNVGRGCKSWPQDNISKGDSDAGDDCRVHCSYGGGECKIGDSAGGGYSGPPYKCYHDPVTDQAYCRGDPPPGLPGARNPDDPRLGSDKVGP